MKNFLLIWILSLILVSAVLFSQNKKIDSLERVLLTLPTDSVKIDLLNVVSIELRNSSPEKSLQYAKDALLLSEKINYSKGKATSYNNIGANYQEKGDYALAIDFHYKSLKIKEEIGDKIGMAKSYGNIGWIHSQQKKYDIALEYFLKSLKISEEMNDKKMIANNYNNIGENYRRSKDYDRSREYQIKSLKIKEELNDKRGMAASYNNIGLMYHHEQNYPKAIEYHQFAFKIQKELNDRRGMAISFGNIGEAYDRLGKHDLAIDFHQKALNIAMEIDDKVTIKNAYQGMAIAYRNKNDFRNAYLYLDSFSSIKDSLFNIETSSKISNLQVQYELEKKERERELLLKQKDIEQKAELTKQKLIRNSFIGGFMMVLILAFILYRRYEDRKLANIKLEYQYQEINRQKNEIEQNRDQIAKQKEKITDSINYAKRIQEAILPPAEEIKKAFTDSFILYKPKDIVSGDFYWFASAESSHIGCNIIAAVDCTGHGVPGAFMSMIGSELLNQIIIEKKITEPSKILKQLHADLRNALKQHEEDTQSRDGMDIALCAFDTKNSLLQFAGAYRPLYIFRKNETHVDLHEIKGEKYPVAGFHLAKERIYNSHPVSLQKGDTVYIFSDGYCDQFGGTNGQIKFTTRRFKEVLLSIQSKPMPEQHKELDKLFSEWKGENNQLDDILVIGIRV